MSRHWLLTAEIAGQPLRWSSEPVEVVTQDGTRLPYVGGLTVDTVELAAQGPGNDPQIPQIGVEVSHPEDLDLIELIEAGHKLSEGRAELAIWQDGQTYEQRRVLVVGFLDEEEVDLDGLALRASLTTTEQEGDGATVPEEGAQVTAETFAPVRDAWIGADYPIPIGRPGAGDGSTHPASPARPAEWGTVAAVEGVNLLVVADRAVSATQVRLWYGDDMIDGGLFPVVTGPDDLGRTVSTVDTSAAGATIRTAGKWWCSWEEGAGVLLPDGSPVETLGDALYWAAHESGLPLDLRAWSALRAALAGWKVGAVIDTPTPVWGWARDVLLPMAPIELVDGPDGLRPLLWTYPARAADAVRHLEVGREIHMAGPVERAAAADSPNRWRVAFGFRPDGEATGEIVIGSEDRPAPACTVAQSQAALREESLELVAVSRESAAAMSVGWRVASEALPWRTTTYGGLADDLDELRPGDVVTITHADRGWLERVAHVRAVRWLSTDEIEIAVLLLSGVGHSGID